MPPYTAHTWCNPAARHSARALAFRSSLACYIWVRLGTHKHLQHVRSAELRALSISCGEAENLFLAYCSHPSMLALVCMFCALVQTPRSASTTSQNGGALSLCGTRDGTVQKEC